MSRYSNNLRETGRVNRFIGKFLGKRGQIQNKIVRIGSLVGCLAATAMVVLAPGISAKAAETVPTGDRSGVVWTFDVALPGPNLPPQGVSLFDTLFASGDNGSRTYDVPFPFAALRQRIRTQTQGNEKNEVGIKETLIPFSRALPRMAAAPEFIKYPRIVLAVDGDFPSSTHRQDLLLKDRLYIGYQEKAESLEVISYNEVAGRFEFQIVRDYAAGETPQVFYAERRLCVSCHQNGGPIFSEPPWSETNGNPEIGRQILRQMQSFHGVASYSGHQTIDQARAISDAVERANLFSAYQVIWRKGCGEGLPESAGVACRKAMLTAILQYKLSGSRHFDTTSNHYRKDLAEPLRQAWRRYWPKGLAIPDPRIPDRDPLITGAAVSAESDPLGLRPPMQLWSVDDPGVIEALIRGLSRFISNSDARQLDAHLFSAASGPGFTRKKRESPCALSRRRYEGLPQRIGFHCETEGADPIFASGYLYLDESGGVTGETRGLRLDEPADFEELALSASSISVEAGRSSVSLTPMVKRTGLHPRLPDGTAIESIGLSWDAIIEEEFGPSDEIPNYRNNGFLEVTLMQDFAPLEEAIADLARDARRGGQYLFSAQPFRRDLVIGNLFKSLGVSAAAACCVAEESFPVGEVESPKFHLASAAGGSAPSAKVRQAYAAYCAVCHRTGGPFPANFLGANLDPFGEALKQCGQRIAYRLSMWDRPEKDRNKTPMPPQSFLLSAGLTAQEWRSSTSFAELRSHMPGLLALSGSSLDRVETIGAKSYEALPPCLAIVD
jgi:mono/diheme cytochrome c family protein